VQFEKDFRSKFGHSVNFVGGFRRREFLLVISFGRSKFKLDIHTVSIVLQACFGGTASRFHVKLLRDRTFHFSVASRSVGFHIYNIGKFSDKDFEFSINLWGDGGPNWKFEESKFYIEQDKEWTQVKSKKSIRTSLFKRLFFPAQNSNKSPVPVSTVFDRINLTIMSAPKPAINLSNSNNVHSSSRANSTDRVNSNLMWVPKRSQREQSEAKLPGILPYMKFASFPKVVWPDDSYQKWFKAHGPTTQIKQVSCLKDLGPSFFGAKINSASSTSFATVQAAENSTSPSIFPSSSVAGGCSSNGEHSVGPHAVCAVGF
jgi:hypothetical protein